MTFLHGTQDKLMNVLITISYEGNSYNFNKWALVTSAFKKHVKHNNRIINDTCLFKSPTD